MYEAFYNLREKPFGLLPDPDFIYWSSSHAMAYTMLEYGVVNNAGFTVITGGVGCGKTTLVRFLLTQLTDDVKVGLLSNTRIEDGDFLRWVMMALGQPYDQTTSMAVFGDFQKFLIDQYAKQRRTLLIVDEAQHFSAATLEELRMLSNINADKDQLLQIMLVGQPELRDTLQAPELLQFVQRVSSDYHLHPLDSEDVFKYVGYRVERAGGSPELFSAAACEVLARASNGVPRVINLLCDTALVYAYASNVRHVSPDIVRSVVEDKTNFGLLLR
jgi:general secretion pathway protein A